MIAEQEPLISVIIPTYNYAHFLPKAIESILKQTYQNFEIIVIDDGSTDCTMPTVRRFNGIKYFHQENKGLAAARNAGIMQSNGKYLVFLDADDWLETDALQNNYSALKNHSQAAFVSGNYYFLRADTNELTSVQTWVNSNYYLHLLRCNYIGMHAAVMFRRWVFDIFSYDENLKACEDYDLYLRIARAYPIIHHNKFIATYYFHSSGLSHNYRRMMQSVQAVMQKQAEYILTEEERSAYEEGVKQWKVYYDLQENSKQHTN